MSLFQKCPNFPIFFSQFLLHGLYSTFVNNRWSFCAVGQYNLFCTKRRFLADSFSKMNCGEVKHQMKNTYNGDRNCDYFIKQLIIILDNFTLFPKFNQDLWINLDLNHTPPPPPAPVALIQIINLYERILKSQEQNSKCCQIQGKSQN